MEDFRAFVSRSLGGPSRYEVRAILGEYDLGQLLVDVRDHMTITEPTSIEYSFKRETPNPVVKARLDAPEVYQGTGLESLVTSVQLLVGIDRPNLVKYSQVKKPDMDSYYQAFRDILAAILPAKKPNPRIKSLGLDLSWDPVDDLDLSQTEQREELIDAVMTQLVEDGELDKLLTKFIEDYSIMSNFHPELSDRFACDYPYYLYNVLGQRMLVQYKPDSVEYYQEAQDGRVLHVSADLLAKGKLNFSVETEMHSDFQAALNKTKR